MLAEPDDFGLISEAMPKAKRKLVEWALIVVASVGLVQMAYLMLNEEGGALRIARLNAEIERQLGENRKIQIENALLRAQIAEIKRRPETKEAMARFQLNMIRPDEVFIQTPSPE